MIRRSYIFLTFIILPLIISSCSSGSYKGLKPLSGPFYWTASYYADQFHGRPTASGEIFNMHDMTAAHKTLPFGTRLHVTNLESGQSVVVTVNDRGPFVKGRSLDLSLGAAKEIDMINSGTARVKAVIVGRDTGYVKTVSYGASSGPFTIQAGSFGSKDNALRLKDSLAFSYKRVFTYPVMIKGKRFYRVCVGKFGNREDADKVANKLADEGYSVIIITYDERA